MSNAGYAGLGIVFIGNLFILQLSIVNGMVGH